MNVVRRLSQVFLLNSIWSSPISVALGSAILKTDYCCYLVTKFTTFSYIPKIRHVKAVIFPTKKISAQFLYG